MELFNRMYLCLHTSIYIMYTYNDRLSNRSFVNAERNKFLIGCIFLWCHAIIYRFHAQCRIEIKNTRNSDYIIIFLCIRVLYICICAHPPKDWVNVLELSHLHAIAHAHIFERLLCVCTLIMYESIWKEQAPRNSSYVNKMSCPAIYIMTQCHAIHNIIKCPLSFLDMFVMCMLNLYAIIYMKYDNLIIIIMICIEDYTLDMTNVIEIWNCGDKQSIHHIISDWWVIFNICINIYMCGATRVHAVRYMY